MGVFLPLDADVCTINCNVTRYAEKDASKEVQAAALAEIDVAAVVAAVEVPEGSKMKVCTWPEWVALTAEAGATAAAGGAGAAAAADLHGGGSGGGGAKRKRDETSEKK